MPACGPAQRFLQTVIDLGNRPGRPVLLVVAALGAGDGTNPVDPTGSTPGTRR